MYFLPLISYCLTSSIRKESFIYSMYFAIVVFDILLFFTDLKVLLSLVGLVMNLYLMIKYLIIHQVLHYCF